MNDRCVICGSPVSDLGKAVIMPFVAHRIWGDNNPVTYTRLFRCNFCGFAFYGERFSEEEMAIYYNEYWTESYFKQRNKYEWWFTSGYRDYNYEIGYLTRVNKRQKDMTEIINPYINDIKTVLDYGGNNGDYRPNGIKEKNYFLYDINNKKIKLKKKYDLIMFNCVLEHVPYPINIIKSINFKYLYIEVPFTFPLRLSLTIKRTWRQYIIDIFKIIRYRCFYHMHEHINYFSEKSLAVLAEKMGCEILLLDKHDIVYRLLARKIK